MYIRQTKGTFFKQIIFFNTNRSMDKTKSVTTKKMGHTLCLFEIKDSLLDTELLADILRNRILVNDDVHCLITRKCL